MIIIIIFHILRLKSQHLYVCMCVVYTFMPQAKLRVNIRNFNSQNCFFRFASLAFRIDSKVQHLLRRLVPPSGTTIFNWSVDSPHPSARKKRIASGSDLWNLFWLRDPITSLVTLSMCHCHYHQLGSSAENDMCAYTKWKLQTWQNSTCEHHAFSHKRVHDSVFKCIWKMAPPTKWFTT